MALLKDITIRQLDGGFLLDISTRHADMTNPVEGDTPSLRQAVAADEASVINLVRSELKSTSKSAPVAE